MIEILTKIPLYKMAHATGWPRMLPLNLTVSVTYRCNSRCLTCNVYTKDAEEFTVDEFDRTFRSLGHAPYWYTMSGGEPFLRSDLPDICESAYRHGAPGIINIPTNGLLSSRIPSMVEEIAGRCPKTQVIINLSLDGIGEAHGQAREPAADGFEPQDDHLRFTLLELRVPQRPSLGSPSSGFEPCEGAVVRDRHGGLAEFRLAFPVAIGRRGAGDQREDLLQFHLRG